MKEIWKIIAGHGGMYEVSNLGRVRSYCTTGRGAGTRLVIPRVMTPTPNGAGYLYLALAKPDRSGYTRAAVHRLVAQEFIGPAPSPEATVNHKDLKKAHNVPSNLEWMSHADNNRHAAPLIPHEQGEQRANHKLTEDDVREIRRRWLNERETLTSLAKHFGVSLQTCSAIVKRQKWKHVL